MRRPTLSPDGTRYAAKVAIRGKRYFAIVPVAGGETRRIGTGDADPNWWRWVGDGWLVLGVGQVKPVGGEKIHSPARAVGTNG